MGVLADSKNDVGEQLMTEKDFSGDGIVVIFIFLFITCSIFSFI